MKERSFGWVVFGSILLLSALSCGENKASDDLRDLRAWLERQKGTLPLLTDATRQLPSDPADGSLLRGQSFAAGAFPEREVAALLDEIEAGAVDPGTMNAASVALWARFLHRESIADAFRSLDLALALPEEPLFERNRAVIAGQLGLTRQARRRWQGLLDDGRFGDEAAQWLAEKDQQPPRAALSAEWPELLENWRRGALEADLAVAPSLALRVADLALQAWSQAPTGAAGREALSVFETASRAVPGNASMVALADHLRSSNDRAAEAISRWIEFEGALLTHPRKVERASELIPLLERDIARLDLPLEPWLTYYRALWNYLRWHHGETLAGLSSWQSSADDGRVGILALRLRGLVERDLGDLSAGVGFLRAAGRLAQEIGDGGGLADQEASLAIVRGEFLQDLPGAWESLAAAWGVTFDELTFKSHFRVIEAAERVASAAGLRRAAIEVQGEAVTIALESSDELLVQDGYADLQKVLFRGGQREMARDLEAERRRAAERIGGDALRDAVRLQELGMVAAFAESPEEEIEHRGERLSLLQARQMFEEVPFEQAALGWAFLRAGDLDLAMEQFEQARKQVEEQADRLASPIDIAFWARRARPIYDGLVQGALEDSPDQGAFEFSESGRGQVLLRAFGELDSPREIELPPATAVLSFHWLGAGGDRRLYGWWLDAGGLRTKLLSAGQGATDLEATILELRRRIENPRAEEEHVLPRLRQLHKALIAPWLDQVELADLERLVIVPDGNLYQVPFAALLGERFLIEEVALVVSPSAVVYSQLQQRLDRRSSRIEEALVMAFAGSEEHALGRLEFAEDEARLIAAVYGGRPLLGDQASFDNLVAAGAGSRLLHVASHGQASKDRPLASRLLLASADPRLAADPVSVARLLDSSGIEFDIVVLSACETAVGEVTAGEGTISLAWPFLLSGSHSVVSSQWRVDDRETLKMMATFHHQLADKGPAEALQTAQVETLNRLRERSGGASWVKVWAAFQVLGSG
ncbi:MAG: CHAT domain-containing protein [Acidobacteriota bacterium]